MSHVHTERGFDRLVNFSDAVVAIAITLLVLPLTDVAGDISDSSTPLTLWNENSNTIVAFLISFVVLANYWLIHHRLFEEIDDYDGGLTWLNIGWLFAIIVLPFSTELVSQFGFANGWGLVYCLNFAVISLFLALIGHRVQSRPALQGPGFETGHMRQSKSILYAGYFLAVGLLSLVNPTLASFTMIGLWPLSRYISAKDARAGNQ